MNSLTDCCFHHRHESKKGLSSDDILALLFTRRSRLSSVPSLPRPITQEFTTPGLTTFTIPQGVSRVTITADGGHGGNAVAGSSVVGGNSVAAGGPAATVTAVFSVQGSTKLAIF